MAVRFAVGSTFESYEKFEEELSAYKSTSFSEYFIKDCRTLEAAKKRYPHRVEIANAELKYYFIKLMCVHGGSYKKRKTTDERNASSMRQGCNAYIYVKLSEDGKNLVIADMCENHNHELCPELFNFFPRQRRLAPDMQQEVLDLLALKANKKLIQEKYTAETNKKITLRDLSNLQAKVKKMTLKWKNIKDNYRRSLRKRTKSAGIGRKYVHAKHLSFLQESMSLAATQSSTEDPSLDSSLSQAAQDEKSSSVASSDPATPGPCCGASTSTVKRRHELESFFVQSMNTPLVVEPSDSNRAFFDSLIPMIKNFSEDQTLEFRSEVIALIRRMKRQSVVPPET